MRNKKIETRLSFPPIHTQPIYNTGQYLPVSENISKIGISLPSAPNLKKNQIKKISQIIRDCVK